VDLTRTIAEIGGAEVPDDWDGDSLLAWLDDASAPWKDLAVSEYYGHNISSGFAMLRRGDWKYVYHTRMNDTHGPERELFNLSEDPGEWDNRAADPAQAGRIEEMHAQLVREVGRNPEEAEAECREQYARGYGRQVPVAG
jgi:choline-sulfatase